MKRAYWFLVGFAVWCIACAIWYMFAIKGLPKDINYFSPHPTLMAIAEVMVMLLVACLLGYAIGWNTREKTIDSLTEITEQLEHENGDLLKVKQQLADQIEAFNQRWARQEHQYMEERRSMQAKTETMQEEVSNLKEQLATEKKQEKKNPLLEQLEAEAQSLRFKIRQLEFQSQESELAVDKLKKELESSINSRRRVDVEPVHPFVRPVSEEDKDDLTLIKGIGPFIEKRLNMVGIYTFRQISEFTTETIEQVTKAIEFFPDRMVRDNWVGQAKALLQDQG